MERRNWFRKLTAAVTVALLGAGVTRADRQCPTCGGSGQLPDGTDGPGPGRARFRPCDACGGSGRIADPDGGGSGGSGDAGGGGCLIVMGALTSLVGSAIAVVAWVFVG